MSNTPTAGYRESASADDGSERGSCTDEAEGHSSCNTSDCPPRHSNGSIGSNDERLHRYQDTLGHTARDNEGEPRFFTDTSQFSDAQRNNVVNALGSGSRRPPDNDMENARSQDDQSSLAANILHLYNAQVTAGISAVTVSDTRSSSLNRRTNSSGSRAVDFAQGAYQHLSGLHSYAHRALQISAGNQERDSYPPMNRHHGDMGPPMSRGILIHKAGSTGEGSVKSYGSNDGAFAHSDDGGSLDNVDMSSNLSQDYHHVARSLGKDSQTGDNMMGEGSHDGADTDDCGGSLDVETHSVHSFGTRSNYSQDDIHRLPTEEPITVDDSSTVDLKHQPYDEDAASDDYVSLGRRSPEVFERSSRNRRYHGRFVNHLPLKRFLEQEEPQPDFSLAHFEHDQDHWRSEDHYRQRHRSRRSRSRSRSPTHHQYDPEDDRKPAGRDFSSDPS